MKKYIAALLAVGALVAAGAAPAQARELSCYESYRVPGMTYNGRCVGLGYHHTHVWTQSGCCYASIFATDYTTGWPFYIWLWHQYNWAAYRA